MGTLIVDCVQPLDSLLDPSEPDQYPVLVESRETARLGACDADDPERDTLADEESRESFPPGRGAMGWKPVGLCWRG